MPLIEMYGKTWEIDGDETLGQAGLIAENHYRPLFQPAQRGLSLEKGDWWLDIGANIGAFCVRAAEFVGGIVAVEPEPNCVQQLQRNLEINKVRNVEVIEKAVVGFGQTSVPLAISNSYSSTHRIGEIRGRKIIEVPAVDINQLLKDWSINKIKMDCEGTEAEILEQADLTPIEEIIFEYHFSFIKDDPWGRYFDILEKLRKNGMIIHRGANQMSKTWHTIVWAKRL